MDVIPFTERNAIFARLGETASRLNLNEEERIQYNDELKKYRDYFAKIDFAKDSGIQEGIEKGIEIGEKQKAFSIAANLKNLGMSVEQIVSVTGLSVEEITIL